MYIVGCCDQIISNRQYIKHMFWSPECLEPSPSTTGGVWWAALLPSFAFTQIGARSCYLHRGHHLTKGWHCFCCRNLVGPTCRDPHQIAKKSDTWTICSSWSQVMPVTPWTAVNWVAHGEKNGASSTHWGCEKKSGLTERNILGIL